MLRSSQLDEKETGKYLFHKERGETLAMLLVRFRQEKNIADGIKITYAGRLDPMASGEVLLLVGDARFEKESYLKLSKIYEVDIVFGFTTDSLDPLGVISNDIDFLPDIKKIEEVFENMPEKLELPYPTFSSPLVDGKPLFVHARTGNEVAIPRRTARIYEKEFLRYELISAQKLSEDAIEAILKVQGDFRQDECIASWKTFAEKNGNKTYVQCSMRFVVSSGTYIRSIAKWFGEQVGIPAYAHHIQRIGYIQEK